MGAQTIVNGLLTGGIYAVAALGLSLVWGVMHMINVAHADILIFMAYMAYFLVVSFGLPPLVALVVLFPLGFLAGALVYRGLAQHLIRRSEVELMSLVLFFGFGTMVYGVSANQWGADFRSLRTVMPTWRLGELVIPTSRLTAFVTAVVLMVGLMWFLRHTYIGKAIRAVAQSRDAARALGIDPDQISTIAFGISLAYAGVAGALITLTSPLSPSLSLAYIGRAFAVVVLGGLGNPLGTLAGGMILGLAENISARWFTYGLSPAVAFVILILVLIFRPQGLFKPLRER